MFVQSPKLLLSATLNLGSVALVELAAWLLLMLLLRLLLLLLLGTGCVGGVDEDNGDVVEDGDGDVDADDDADDADDDVCGVIDDILSNRCIGLIASADALIRFE